MNFAQNRLD